MQVRVHVHACTTYTVGIYGTYMYMEGGGRKRGGGVGRERGREIHVPVGYKAHLAKTRLSDHTGNDHSEDYQHENCHHCCCKDE